MSVPFSYDIDQATTSLVRMAAAPARLVMEGPLFAQGLMGSLISAEWIAAQAGVVPFIEVEGQRGIVDIGRARVRMASPTPPPGVLPELYAGARTMYLAAHGAARTAHNDARILEPAAARAARPVGGFFVPVILACVAIAGIIAAAKYTADVRIRQIEIDGETARANARLKVMTEAAARVFDATGQYPPELWATLRSEAELEAKKPAGGFDWIFAGGVALGVGALAAGAYVLTPRGLLRAVR